MLLCNILIVFVRICFFFNEVLNGDIIQQMNAVDMHLTIYVKNYVYVKSQDRAALQTKPPQAYKYALQGQR